jgi:hypothetical protein
MDCTENTVPLLLLTGRCVITTVVYLFVSRLFSSSESTCQNIYCTEFWVDKVVNIPDVLEEPADSWKIDY